MAGLKVKYHPSGMLNRQLDTILEFKERSKIKIYIGMFVSDYLVFTTWDG